MDTYQIDELIETVIKTAGEDYSINILVELFRNTEKALREAEVTIKELQNNLLWQSEELKARNEELSAYSSLLQKQNSKLIEANKLIAVKAAAEAVAETEKRKANELHALNQQLRAKEQALLSSQSNLGKKIMELERMNKFMINRELKMMELKEKIKELESELQFP